MERRSEPPNRLNDGNVAAKDTRTIKLLKQPQTRSSIRSSTMKARNRRSGGLCSEIGKWFTDWWMGELLAILMSIIAFFAIVFVLNHYDGHALPRLPHNVTLGFITSTLATVSKGSLLLAIASAIGQYKWLWISSRHRPLQDLQAYDEASRRLLGSSKFLTSKKVLKSWAALGALVTIICFFFEPFIQGLIHVSERVVYHDSSNSLLNIADVYPLLYSTKLDYPFANAITDAAFNRGDLLETRPHCPTGNCTWPIFTSLGFCSDCQDFTEAMQNSSTYEDKLVDKHGRWIGIIRTYTYRFPNLNGKALIVASSRSSLITPGQRSFSVDFPYDYEETSSGLGTDVPYFLIVPLSWDDALPLNLTDDTSISTSAATMAFIHTSAQAKDVGRILQADVCGLSLCVQKRNVSVSSNRLSSRVVETVQGRWNSGDPASQKGYGTGWWPGWIFEGDDINMTYPANWSTNNPQVWEPISVRGMQNAIHLFFSGNITWRVTDESYGRPSSNIMYAFNASTNIPATMHNVATAMTNYIRDRSDVTVSGKVGVSETYIQVNWAWITLPAFLILAGTAFLIITMVETKVRGTRVWRTDELALLFYRIAEMGQQEVVKKGVGVDKISEMTREASNMRVRLARVNNGRQWALLRR